MSQPVRTKARQRRRSTRAKRAVNPAPATSIKEARHRRALFLKVMPGHTRSDPRAIEDKKLFGLWLEAPLQVEGWTADMLGSQPSVLLEVGERHCPAAESFQASHSGSFRVGRAFLPTAPSQSGQCCCAGAVLSPHAALLCLCRASARALRGTH